jgi:hypothetical protein
MAPELITLTFSKAVRTFPMYAATLSGLFMIPMSNSPRIHERTAMYPVNGRSDAFIGVCDVITFAKPPPMKLSSDPFGCLQCSLSLEALSRPAHVSMTEKQTRQ